MPRPAGPIPIADDISDNATYTVTSAAVAGMASMGDERRAATIYPTWRFIRASRMQRGESQSAAVTATVIASWPVIYMTIAPRTVISIATAIAVAIAIGQWPPISIAIRWISVSVAIEGISISIAIAIGRVSGTDGNARRRQRCKSRNK
jgi:hypothetical protein